MADWFDAQAADLPAGTARPRQPAGTIDTTQAPGRSMPGTRGTGTPASGGPQPYSDAALQAILHRYPATNDGMRAAMAEVDRTFGPGTVKLLDHPQRLDKLVLPDGRNIDSIRGAGAPGAEWTWIVEGGGGHAGGGGMLQPGQTAQLGSLLGDPMAGRSITDDPSYRFRFDEGLKALERSAASRGTLLTGGMLKALSRYGQNLASTEYQNSYARRANEQGNTFSRLYGVANMGLNAAGTAGQFGTSYGNQVSQNQLQGGNAAAAGTVGGANAWNGMVGNLANIGTQYFQGRATGDPNNTGNWIDQGRGLY